MSLSKAAWGNITWLLIHTLTYKLQDTEVEHIPHLWKVLVYICTTLPCDDCSAHAKRYLMAQSSPPSTKQKLISYFWHMHNTINTRLNKPNMSVTDFKNKYKLANLRNISIRFIETFSLNTHATKGMLNTFSRNLLTSNFKKYINENHHRYNI